MPEPDEIRRRKQRSTRTVLGGAGLITVGMLMSVLEIVTPLTSTAIALAGFVMILYGVHLGWVVFYEREPDGPSS